VNLARVLTKGARFQEALQVFNQLDFMQQLEGRPAAQLAFGQALAGGGDAGSAQETLEGVLKSSSDAKVSRMCACRLAQTVGCGFELFVK
jgi:hypothetical protein